MKRGLTHIYTGDGKGKTSAAAGLIARAAGCGLSAALFQFCKGVPSGEVAALMKCGKVYVERAECPVQGFVWEMSDEDKEAWVEAQQALFDVACDAACDGGYDVVVLDEIFAAMSAGAMDSKQIAYLMKRKYKGTELVLTGRGAPADLIELADYATEMRCVRHPYDHGVQSRRGIEY